MVRDDFHERLAALDASLVGMAQTVTDMMGRASRALLTSDTDLAERVVEMDASVNAMRNRVDDQVAELMTTRPPMAGDLRFMLSAIRITGDLERMGDLSKHIAKIAIMRAPASAVPTEAMPLFTSLAEVAVRIATKATQILGTRDQLDATQLSLDDDEMDALHKRMFAQLLSDWPYGVEAAVDFTLLGRFYERYADHAVNIAHQVVYLVTGDVRLRD
ncbi:phosphate transport system regulatory protein PhoU [Actinorhabdospora filicis]|uniref:Phosphate-specific transport system accessory protein PhoU n=1 Tax=Actinorhabdospora filicis TaxID=1785913 RepID=A0A9W6STL0_9ACTN|nr:phosphate signaling complex protein PhoU [Actinorhabdospora filicis]GLZ81729.1 phosphate transport system regulatory protein PhoU [Actinorhabdospora filicis]